MYKRKRAGFGVGARSVRGGVYRKKASSTYKVGAVRRDGVLDQRSLIGADEGAVSGLHYMQALVEPLDYSDGQARIPDFITTPTQTATLQLEITQPNTGVGGVLNGGCLFLTSNGPRYYCEQPTSTDNAITYYSTAASASNTYGGLTLTTGNTLIPGAYSAAQAFSGYRIVAAGLLVEYIGNDTSNQGTIVSTFANSTDVSNAQIANIGAMSTIENFRHNYTGAAKSGTYVRYLPCDLEDCVIGNCNTPGVLGNVNRRWVSGGANSDAKNYGLLQWHANGLATTGSSFRVTIRIHIEGFLNTEYSGQDSGKVCIAPDLFGKMLATCGNVQDPTAAQPVAVRRSAVDVINSVYQEWRRLDPGLRNMAATAAAVAVGAAVDGVLA